MTTPDPPDPAAHHKLMTTTFLKEVSILAVGVFIGFFWAEYFNQVSNEAHLVVLLLIIILCLVRYIFLFRR